MSQLRQWLDSSALEVTDRQRAVRLLTMFLLCLEGASVFFIAWNLSIGPLDGEFLIQEGLFLLLVLGLHRLLHRGHFDLVAWGLPLLLYGIISLAVFSFGTIRDVTATAYFFILILGALILGEAATMLLGGLVALTILGLFVMEVSGFIHPMRATPQTYDVLIFLFSLFITVALLRVAIHYIKLGFKNAQIHSGALQALNDELEQRIAERTAQLERSNQDLRDSEARYRSWVEQAADGLVVSNAQNRIIEVNARACEILGYPAETLLTLTLSDLFSPEELQRQPLRTNSLQPGQSSLIERLVSRPDGQPIHIEINARRLSTGQVHALLRDITARKQADRAFRENEQLLQSILDNTTTFVVAKDFRRQDGRYILVNKSFAEAFGHTPAELIGKTPYDLFPPHLAQRTDADDRQVYESGQNKQVQEEGFWQGRSHQVVTNKFLLRDADDQPYGICAIATEITELKQTEAALRQSETQLALIFNSTSDKQVLLRVEANDGLIAERANRAFLNDIPQLFPQIASEELQNFLGHDRRDYLRQFGVPPEMIELEMPMYRAAITTQMPVRYETEVPAPAGTITLDVTIIPVLDSNGRCSHVLWTGRDVTERKQLEKARERSEALLKATNRIARTGGWELDLRTNELYWTDTIKEIHEVPLDYVPNLAEGINFYAPEHIPLIQKAVEGAMAGRPYDVELQIVTARHNRLWVRAIGQPVYEGQQVVKLQGVFQDIHARKLTDEALQHSEANLREAQRIARLGNFEFDLTTQAVRWSDEVYRIFGLEVGSEMSLERYQSLLPPGDLQRVMTAVEQTRATQEPYRVEHMAILPDGTHKHVFAIGHPVVNALGQVHGIFGIVQDITERKQLDEALRQSEARLREAQQIAQLGSFELDVQTQTTKISEEVRRIFDTPPDKPLTYADFIHALAPEDKAPVTKAIERTIAEGEAQTFEYDILTPAGERKHLYARARPILSDSGTVTHIFGIVQDITERQRAETALHENEALYRTLFEQSYDGVILHDARTGRVVAANPTIATLLECDIDDLIGTHYFDDLPPEEVPDAHLRWQRTIAETYLPPYERRIITHKGHLREFEITTSAVYDSAGQSRFMQAVLRDITERKRVERQIQASLEEKEVLLREIHHRVKNNLQIISSLLYLQSQKITDASLLELFRESQNRVASMSLIHEQLYQSSDFARVDFGVYARSLIATLFEAYGVDDAQIHLNLDTPEVSLTVNNAIPCGLLINEVISNSLKHAFPAGQAGQITLRLTEQAGYYHLVLSDNGVGLPDSSHIRAGSLGLRLITQLVRQLDGQLEQSGPPGLTYQVRFRVA